MAVVAIHDTLPLFAFGIAQAAADIFGGKPEAALVVDNGNGGVAVEYGGLEKMCHLRISCQRSPCFEQGGRGLKTVLSAAE